MWIEEPGKGVAPQRFPGVGTNRQLDAARSAQLEGVPEHPQATLDAGNSSISTLQRLLIVQVHRFSAGFPETFVKLELEGRHLFQTQTLEGHLRDQGKTVADLPCHGGRRTALVASHCYLRQHSVPRSPPTQSPIISDQLPD